MAFFSTSLASVNAAIAIGKAWRTAETSYSNAQLKLQASDLVDKLVDVKDGLRDAEEAVAAKDAEIQRLKEAFQRHGELVRDGRMKYFADAHGDPDGFPICPSCELDGRLVELVSNSPQYGDAKCPSCRQTVSGAPYCNAEANRTAQANLDAGEERRRLSLEALGRTLV